MNFITLAFCIIILFSCTPKNVMLGEREFTQTYLEELAKTYPKEKFKISSDLTIRVEGGDLKSRIRLKNLYIHYKSNPDSLNSLINKHIQSISVAFTEIGHIDINKIVPIIRSKEYLNKLPQIDNKPALVYEQYNEDLIILFGEDNENNIRYLTWIDLKQLNINSDTLLNFSKKNLVSVINQLQINTNESSYILTVGNGYELSLLLVNSLWTEENIAVNGEFVIAIPNRDILIVTGSSNQSEINKIEKLAINSFRNNEYPISPFLYKWNGDKFERF